MNNPIRIAVLNSHPIQYFAPLYAFLNKIPELEITALYLSDFSIRGGKDEGFGREVKWDVDLLAGYRSVFLGKAAQREPKGFWSLVAPEVWGELRSGRYDVLWLHGHNYAANLIALGAAKTMGMPVLMRGETHLGLMREGLKAKLRLPIMAAVYGLCDCLLAIGTANAEFYRAMMVADRKLFLVPYAVDNARFAAAADLSGEQKGAIRNLYKIPADRPAILYAAKFTSRKRPADLLQAVQLLRSRGSSAFTLIMGGSGELEPELRAYCSDNQLNNVIFTGFINQSQLPALYAACDVFVLPSEQEPWGLAVNEAMCAGLPIVVSKEVGCTRDLVSDGVNGYTPDAGNIGALANALSNLIENAELRRAQGHASRQRIDQWGFDRCLEGLRVCLASLPLHKTANPVL
jgi:glycosyltransferase involved in cell wall biosynthesis